MKAWGGRFTEGPASDAADFGRSIEVDAELALDDIDGSIAHVTGLERAGLVDAAEAAQLRDGLASLAADVRAGVVEWDPAFEDIHLNVEMALRDRVGAVAGKLHTGRSRNDQVATDLRLWLKRRTAAIDAAVLDLERALVTVADAHRHAVMPAHTHAQPAQPVLFAHHLLAYVEMLERDRGRFADAIGRADRSPLGAGAVAGAGFAVDRDATARELGFAGVTRNSIDATGDRDPVVETLSAAALTMTHLSRLAEEIAWWTNPHLGYVRPADAYSTGSSMMPNKRNPDMAELVRGRTARVIGHLVTALTLLKGLPGGYQRDLQEDKAPLFDAMDVLDSSLRITAAMVATLHVDEARMREAASVGFTTATSVADTLVERGIAFRAAHHIVGELVARAESADVDLADIDDGSVDAALASAEDEVARALAGDLTVRDAVREAATIDAALARPDVVGGTAPARVHEELATAIERLGLSSAGS